MAKENDDITAGGQDEALEQDAPQTDDEAPLAVDLDDDPAPAAAKAEPDDEERKSRKDYRSDRSQEFIEQLRAENEQLRRERYAAPPQQQAPQGDQMAEALESLRWQAQNAARAAQDERLPESERARAAKEFERLRAQHDDVYGRRFQVDGNAMRQQIQAQMERDLLVSEDPEAFTDPALLNACREEVLRIQSDPRHANLPALALGRMAIKAARARMGKLTTQAAPQSAAQQAKYAGAAPRTVAGTTKRQFVPTAEEVKLAVASFPREEDRASAVKKWIKMVSTKDADWKKANAHRL